MLLMEEEVLEEEYVTQYAIYQYEKANNKYIKDCDKNKELSDL